MGAATLGFFGKPVMRNIYKGVEYSLGKEGLGVVFPGFHPGSTFPREEGISAPI